MGEMAIMDRVAGDLKVEWDAGNAAEVAAARRQFDELREKGFAAFRLRKSGGKGELIRSFDPEAERLILTPPLVGG